jgi:phosphoglucosamine mutase
VTLRFGTDGVRGVANAELTPELVVALGRAAARVFGPITFAVGRDTRRSGPFIEAALTAGLCAEGASVLQLGVVPTPLVARRAAADGVAGAMISASHNPFGDNGVKLFVPGGRKLTDEVEEQLEAELDAVLAGPGAADPPVGMGIGAVTVPDDALGAYVDAVVESIEGRTLQGMRVVLDCAHGGATPVAPAVFELAGADVWVIGGEPDGANINDGFGSTAPGALAAEVTGRGADLGLAFDGDADRLVAVADDGTVVDGDPVLCLFAVDMKARGRLPHDTLVVTVMSNVGLHRAMQRAGIGVVETPVGDRYVLDELERGGFGLGGEQSGHLIFPALSPTGDGILSGLLLADLLCRSGRRLSELAPEAMQRLPQVLLNVPVVQRPDNITSELSRELAAAERTIGGSGRVLLRPSGTEPLVRVMVEAEDAGLAEAVADSLAEEVTRRFGRHPSR